MVGLHASLKPHLVVLCEYAKHLTLQRAFNHVRKALSGDFLVYSLIELVNLMLSFGPICHWPSTSLTVTAFGVRDIRLLSCRSIVIFEEARSEVARSCRFAL